MLIDGHNHLGADLFFYLNSLYPYAQDLPALAIEGRRNGISRWVVFPMVANLWFDVAAMRRGELVPGGLEAVPYAFENERMLREIYQLHPELGRMTIPFAILDPAREQAEQVRWLRELHGRFPYYGLKIQPTMIQAPILSLLGDGRGFVDLAAELDIPILIHSSVAPEDRWSQAFDILKVVESAPHVRFCLAHSCRFDRAALDRTAELPNAWFDCSAHRIHCESVVRGLSFVAPAARRFPADYTDPAAALQALTEAYPKKLIWGSDSPFQSYVDGRVSLISTYEEETACLHALPPALKQAAGRDNLLALLRLKNESLLSGG